ncbi:MAG TPA: glutathione S-transferase N-terminal domain-containing protein [Polyangiaceae bacterium]|nr:glutathione S-transferase N-terminal domain-containing protein [Polyangiaceae bacterium]
MIELYTWTTPNGLKPHILLEEAGLPYRMHAVNLRKGEQKQPEFLRINPNGKIPALVDPEGDGGEVRVFESGAMMIYLAEKTGQFLPRSGQARAEVLSWLMFQMGGVGPMMGQLAHFRDAKREDPYPLERYSNEVLRLAKVLDDRLAVVPFMAGDYSIADMATFPWIRRLSALGVDTAPYPHIARWVAAQEERPAVKRALAWKPALT